MREIDSKPISLYPMPFLVQLVATGFAGVPAYVYGVRVVGYKFDYKDETGKIWFYFVILVEHHYVDDCGRVRSVIEAQSYPALLAKVRLEEGGDGGTGLGSEPDDPGVGPGPTGDGPSTCVEHELVWHWDGNAWRDDNIVESVDSMNREFPDNDGVKSSAISVPAAKAKYPTWTDISYHDCERYGPVSKMVGYIVYYRWIQICKADITYSC
jgi:hypothetical protein